MDPTTRTLTMGASGSAAKTYVEDVFSTWLYTGNSSTQTITNGIDLSGKGGLLWLKSRSSFSAFEVRQPDHFLTNTTGSSRNFLSSNKTDGSTGSLAVSSFNSNGFSLDNQADGASSGGRGNLSGVTYASWTFRKAEKFFDVVTWTGSGANRTISHNLGSVPGCIIVKRTDTTGDWQVYHRSLANTEYMVLNSTAAKATGATRWNSSTPTSTVFSLGTDATVNASGGTYVAYLFAHDAGGFGDSGNDSVVSCGSFTTDGSGNATVTLGWEPQWLLYKRSDGATNQPWVMFDSMRGYVVGNGDAYLTANTSNAESSANSSNPTATGFTVSEQVGTYIYIAIRRGPMKTPTDATKVFSALTATGSSGTSRSVGFAADMIWGTMRGGDAWRVQDRLRGFPVTANSGNVLWTTSTNAEAAIQPNIYNVDNISRLDGGATATVSYLWHHFRRAPGFFDVVAYAANTTVNLAVNHGLSVTPEMFITKQRDGARDWWTWHAAYPTDRFAINRTDGPFAGGLASSPTSTQITLSSFSSWNQPGNHIMYLFASCPGVSKVGSYTGTGTTLNIDCGFTAGARFVLIKRTDSTGSWYVWDTARGIVSGNDPYLLLNSTAAEVTNTDYIDPLSSGFQISSTAPAEINANGGSYIFLAVA